MGASSSLLMATMIFEILHARQMLDRARNANSNGEIGCNDFACLPDLPIVGRVARIHRRTTGAQSRTEFVGHRHIIPWNFSAEPSARPPEMMILADVNSGRSLFERLFSTKIESDGSAGACTASIGAVPPSGAAWRARSAP